MTDIPAHGTPTALKRPRDLSALVPYFFILPAVAIMLAGLVYPVIQAFYLSFYDWKIGTDFQDAPYVGLRHFTRMLTDENVWESIWVTLRFGFWTISIEMFLGVSLALLLEKPIRGASVFRTIFILPLMVSPVVVGLIWRYLFDARIGWINYYLGLIGIEPQVWLGDADLAFFAIVFTDIWQWTPFIFIIVIAGLQALPSEVLEASKIDGANWWQHILFVKLPMIRSILMIALLMRLIDVFRALEVMYILTGGGPGRSTELLSLHIYNRAFDTQQLGYASAISVLLIVIVTLLSLGILRMGNPMKDKSDI
ncbi:carbohydrate ABC transporter permease [Pacificoceanicola onchidii]|uniref:carbohydrate ABC transporter permease n=1 Tax=Pacificoceanicola onchidii TaxID=2562685 RepID=UPI0010A62524|nr:sugar ABC transporter permease [Pacificoceanicola onchidii]